MAGPAFQFYPGDWLRSKNLRRCSLEARGAWIEVLCLMHDSDEYGVLRWPLADVAQASGVPLKVLRELIDKGVLKGGDKGCEAFVYQPSHAGKKGEPVTLVAGTVQPIWYSSRMVKDEWVRGRRGAGTRFGDTPKDPPDRPPSRPPTRRVGEGSGDGPASASASADPSLRSGSSPPSVPPSPPDPEPASPPAPPDPTPAAPAAKRSSARIALTSEALPETWREVAERKLPGWDHDGLYAFFRDHHIGKGNLQADWPATWRTWLHNAPERSRQFAPGWVPRGAPQPSKGDLFDERLRRGPARPEPQPDDGRTIDVDARSKPDERPEPPHLAFIAGRR